MQQQAFIMKQLYQAPIKKVWEAITDKSKMKEWYFDIPDFEPEPGTEFRFNGGTENKTYVHVCKVTELIPLKKISYTWRYEGYGGDSLLSFELTEEGETTILTLTHSGLDSFPADNPDFHQDNFAKGWKELLGISLQHFVETTNICKTVLIDAPADKIWNILTDHDKLPEWASAFNDGTYVETDWIEGSLVDWKDAEGNTGARGIIQVNKKNQELKIRYYDNVTSMPPAELGEYIERFLLIPTNGQTELKIETGPLPKRYYSMHEPMWIKAVENLKTMAEKAMSIGL